MLLSELVTSPFQQGLRIVVGMKLVSVALMFLGSLAFLGSDAARLDVASEFRKKWSKWALSRGKRELRDSSSYPSALASVKAGPAQTLIRPQDVRSASRSPQASSADAARIRVKRYRQSMKNFQGSRSFGCRFGTCTVQNLAHQIYQFTDKDKDDTAPGTRSALKATAAGAGAPCPRPAGIGLWCLPSHRRAGLRAPGSTECSPPSLGFRRSWQQRAVGRASRWRLPGLRASRAGWGPD